MSRRRLPGGAAASVSVLRKVRYRVGGVSVVPEHIAVRRANERARRRRRRAQALAALLLLACVVGGGLAVTGTFGGHASAARARSGAGATPVYAQQSPSLGPRGSSAGAGGALRRLIALGLPVYCGGPHGHDVAFTFDDGPGVYTHYAVTKLAAAHERATFFVVGKSIRAYPGWLRRETPLAALGDHTMTHADLMTLSAAQAYQEIGGAKALIESQSGQPVALFRPPYGARDATLDAMVRRLGMLDVMWSVDSADSLGANYAAIIRNVENGLRPGAIIEMHENRGQTIRALTTLLPELRRRHLHSVSLLQLLSTDPPSAAQVRGGERACGGPSRIHRRGSE